MLNQNIFPYPNVNLLNSLQVSHKTAQSEDEGQTSYQKQPAYEEPMQRMKI